MSRGYSIARQAFAAIERRKRWGQMHTGKVWTLYALDAPALRGWGHGRTLRAAMNDAIGQAARRDTQLRLRDAAYARADTAERAAYDAWLDVQTFGGLAP